MRRRHFVGMIVSLAVAGGCAPDSRRIEVGQALGVGERRIIEATVDSAMHAYLAAVVARDAERVIGYYANHPEFMAYMEGAPVNREAQINAVRSVFAGLRTIALEPVTVQVTVLAQDAAIAAFAFRETLTDTAGKVMHLRGTASWTWKRSGGSWSIIHGDGVHLPDTASARR